MKTKFQTFIHRLNNFRTSSKGRLIFLLFFIWLLYVSFVILASASHYASPYLSFGDMSVPPTDCFSDGFAHGAVFVFFLFLSSYALYLVFSAALDLCRSFRKKSTKRHYSGI